MTDDSFLTHLSHPYLSYHPDLSTTPPLLSPPPTGEVCPANWQPGEPTMNPDPAKSKAYFSKVHGDGKMES